MANNDDDEPLPGDEEPSLRRRRIRLIIAICSVVLVVLIIFGGIGFAHSFMVVGIAPTPIPTPTLIPGEDLFYIDRNPAWGTISIDGHVLTNIPQVGAYPPLKFSRGIHQLVWHVDPFHPQSCNVFVPPQNGANPCSANDTVSVRKDPGVDTGLEAHVISLTVSLALLPDAQRTALIHAMQSLLDAQRAMETVQPGERFAHLQSTHFTDVASQPLQASLSYQLDTDPNTIRPCMGFGNGPTQSCRVQGRDCLLFCTSEFAPTQFATYTSWDVYIVIRYAWNYTNLGGQIIAKEQPNEISDSGTEYLYPVDITWKNNTWHVINIPNPSINASNTITCAVTQSRIGADYTLNTAAGVVNQIQWSYASGNNPATGCLAEADLTPLNATPVATPGPIAYCLYRFGVLLAANALAHRYWPTMLVANAYEMSLAQQLAKNPAVPAFFP